MALSLEYGTNVAKANPCAANNHNCAIPCGNWERRAPARLFLLFPSWGSARPALAFKVRSTLRVKPPDSNSSCLRFGLTKRHSGQAFITSHLIHIKKRLTRFVVHVHSVKCQSPLSLANTSIPLAGMVIVHECGRLCNDPPLTLMLPPLPAT
jgi:hypothetical protein